MPISRRNKFSSKIGVIRKPVKRLNCNGSQVNKEVTMILRLTPAEGIGAHARGMKS